MKDFKMKNKLFKLGAAIAVALGCSLFSANSISKSTMALMLAPDSRTVSDISRIERLLIDEQNKGSFEDSKKADNLIKKVGEMKDHMRQARKCADEIKEIGNSLSKEDKKKVSDISNISDISDISDISNAVRPRMSNLGSIFGSSLFGPVLDFGNNIFDILDEKSAESKFKETAPYISLYDNEGNEIKNVELKDEEVDLFKNVSKKEGVAAGMEALAKSKGCSQDIIDEWKNGKYLVKVSIKGNTYSLGGFPGGKGSSYSESHVSGIRKGPDGQTTTFGDTDSEEVMKRTQDEIKRMSKFFKDMFRIGFGDFDDLFERDLEGFDFPKLGDFLPGRRAKSFDDKDSTRVKELPAPEDKKKESVNKGPQLV